MNIPERKGQIYFIGQIFHDNTCAITAISFKLSYTDGFFHPD